MAFCGEEERERHIAGIRKDFSAEFGIKEELAFRHRLDRIRAAGYAVRDPRTEPLRMTTFGVPIMEENKVAAVMSVSFFKTSVAPSKVKEEVLSPLLETRTDIEHALDFISARTGLDPSAHREYAVAP
jgi:IclR family mhp operon transcriptional activator